MTEKMINKSITIVHIFFLKYINFFRESFNYTVDNIAGEIPFAGKNNWKRKFFATCRLLVIVALMSSQEVKHLFLEK